MYQAQRDRTAVNNPGVCGDPEGNDTFGQAFERAIWWAPISTYTE